MSEKIRKADVVVEMDMKGIDIQTIQLKRKRCKINHPNRTENQS